MLFAGLQPLYKPMPTKWVSNDSSGRVYYSLNAFAYTTLTIHLHNYIQLHHVKKFRMLICRACCPKTLFALFGAHEVHEFPMTVRCDRAFCTTSLPKSLQIRPAAVRRVVANLLVLMWSMQISRSFLLKGVLA